MSQIHCEKLEAELKIKLSSTVVRWLSSSIGILDRFWIGAVKADTSCKYCRSDVFKTVATLTWAHVSFLVDMEADGSSFEPEPEVIGGQCEAVARSAKDCVMLLYQLWASDPTDFARKLVESPSVQRRYVWTYDHIIRIKDQLSISHEEGNENFNFYFVIAGLISQNFSGTLLSSLRVELEDTSNDSTPDKMMTD